MYLLWLSLLFENNSKKSFSVFLEDTLKTSQTYELSPSNHHFCQNQINISALGCNRIINKLLQKKDENFTKKRKIQSLNNLQEKRPVANNHFQKIKPSISKIFYQNLIIKNSRAIRSHKVITHKGVNNGSIIIFYMFLPVISYFFPIY